MQYITNKLKYQFATEQAKAEAYSPFAKVTCPVILSISMISKTSVVDCSQIGKESLAVT